MAIALPRARRHGLTAAEGPIKSDFKLAWHEENKALLARKTPRFCILISGNSTYKNFALRNVTRGNSEPGAKPSRRPPPRAPGQPRRGSALAVPAPRHPRPAPSHPALPLGADSNCRRGRKRKCGISNADAERRVARLDKKNTRPRGRSPRPPAPEAGCPRPAPQQCAQRQPTDNGQTGHACYLWSRSSGLVQELKTLHSSVFICLF